jgi:predicted nucleic acid-binding protein
VIADASVLIVFVRAQRLDVLLRTVGKVSVTREVHAEAVDAAGDRPDAQAIARAVEGGRIARVVADRRRLDQIASRYPNLGRGEASVIACALQRKEKVVLMDERAARRAAAIGGLRVVGSLGVLARALHAGVIGSRRELGRVLQDLLEAGLWVSPDLVEAFWQDVGGRFG